MKFLVTGILTLLVLFSCKKHKNNENINPVPYVTVYRQINMDNPEYIKLGSQGGFVYLDKEGYRGIVVIHDFNDQFQAMDRACTYNISDTCAKVTMETSGLFLRCGRYQNQNWTGCCNSQFSLDGNVNAGPATIPLKHYNISKSGNTLTISN